MGISFKFWASIPSSMRSIYGNAHSKDFPVKIFTKLRVQRHILRIHAGTMHASRRARQAQIAFKRRTQGIPTLDNACRRYMLGTEDSKMCEGTTHWGRNLTLRVGAVISPKALPSLASTQKTSKNSFKLL